MADFPFALDPAVLASLQNTLGPSGALAQWEAERLRQEQELASRTTQATQASQQATQAYQGAASAPVEEPSLIDQSIGPLLGNLASIISGNQGYGENAQEGLRVKRKDLLQKRMDNLAALRDNHQRMAEAAEKAGDIEASTKARLKMESLAKTYDMLSQNQQLSAAAERQREGFRNDDRQERTRHKNRLGEIAAQGEQERLTQSKKPGLFSSPPSLDSRTVTTYSGKRYVRVGGLVGNMKNAVITAAEEAGLPALSPAEEEGVKDVDRARRDIRGLRDDVLKLVPRDAQGRLVGVAGRKLSQILQTTTQRGSFKTWRDAAIPTLRAMAGSRGLRITQEQIKLMVKNMPTMDDTYDVAEDKVRIINTMLDNAEAPILDLDWRDPDLEEFRRK